MGEQSEEGEINIRGKRVSFSTEKRVAARAVEYERHRIALLSTSNESRGRQAGGSRSTYVDTGCNSLLVAEGTAERLQDECDVEIEWYGEKDQRQRVVNYGGSEKGKIIGRLMGSDLVSKIEIVEGLSDDLIGIRQWIDVGATVAFSRKEGVVIRGIEGQTVDSNIGQYDAKCGMFIMDLVTWIRKEMEGNKTNAHKAVGIKGHRVTARERRLCMNFHWAMACMPFRTLAYGVECGCWTGVHHEITASALRQMEDRNPCYKCAAARLKTKTSKGSGVMVKYEPGQRFAADYMGKFRKTSLGATGGVAIRDLATGFRKTYGTTTKRGMMEAIRRWKTLMAQNNKKVEGGRCDAGSVENGEEFKAAMADLQLDVITAPDKEPQRDIERSWQTTKDDIAAILTNQNNFKSDDWLTAMHISDNVRNLVPNAQSKEIDPNKTPHELITGRRPDLSMFNELMHGDLVAVETPKDKRGIGISRNMLGRVMGIEYDGYKSAIINYVGKPGSMQRRGRIQLIGGQREEEMEQSARQKRTVTLETNEMDQIIDVRVRGEGEIEEPFTLENIMARQRNSMTNKEMVEEEGNMTLAMVGRALDEDSSDEDDEEDEDDGYHVITEEIVDSWLAMRRDESSTVADEWVESDNRIIAEKARVKRTADNPSVGMLKRDGELSIRWTPSLRKELRGMLDKGALHQTTKEEAIRLGITGHVTAMSMKREGEGEEKSRITINGAQELRNNVFEDRKLLYSPALGEEGFLFIMGMAAYYDMTLYRSDVSQAFLYNDMEDAVVQREIVIHLEEVECGIKGGAYYKYDKLGYGAADAGVVWHGQITGFLALQGKLTASQQLTCIYMRLVGKRGLIIVGLATDDIIQAGTKDYETQEELRIMRQAMDKRWKMTHGEVKTALGIKVERHEDGSLTLTQPSQIEKIKKKFFPNGEVPEMYAPRRKGPEIEEDYEIKVDSSEYRSKLGVMSHMRYTRHDARAGLAIGAESSTDPRVVDDKNLQDLAAYIVTTEDVGLTFQAGPRGANPRDRLSGNGAADASWSTTNEGRSRLGFFLKMGDEDYFESKGIKSGAIVAKSMREESISRSAAACELMAQIEFLDVNKIFRATNAEITGHQSSGGGSAQGQKASTLRHKITDEAIKEMLPSGDPSTLLVDNRTLSQTLMYAMSKPMKKLKILVRQLNMFKEAIRNGEVKQILVGTRDQPADMLTKAQTSPSLQWRHLETLQGTHRAITKTKRRVADMRNKRMSQGRMKQLSATDEIEMEHLMATVAISGVDTADSVRAAREIEIETERNTTEQALESEQMKQFRLDIKDRVKRKFCHMETQNDDRMMIDDDKEIFEDGKKTASSRRESEADYDDDSGSNKRQRTEQKIYKAEEDSISRREERSRESKRGSHGGKTRHRGKTWGKKK